MPCGLMNESSFGFLNEGVITKGLTEWKSHMYAMWPKQWKLLKREEIFQCKSSYINYWISTLQCQLFNVNILLITCQCQHFNVNISMSTFQCQHFNVNLWMSTFKCQPFIVNTSLSTLYFQESYTHFCSVVIMKVKLLSHR